MHMPTIRSVFFEELPSFLDLPDPGDRLTRANAAVAFGVACKAPDGAERAAAQSCEVYQKACRKVAESGRLRLTREPSC